MGEETRVGCMMCGVCNSRVMTNCYLALCHYLYCKVLGYTAWGLLGHDEQAEEAYRAQGLCRLTSSILENMKEM